MWIPTEEEKIGVGKSIASYIDYLMMFFFFIYLILIDFINTAL